MFGIGETELVLILLFSFLVFGPDKLPGMGRTLGRALRQFRNAQEGFNKVVQSDLLDPAADALNEKPKRSEKLRSAASDDSDLDSDAPKQETFAERRARLKAEREAAEKSQGAEATQAPAADVAPDNVPAAEPDTESRSEAVPEVAPEEKPKAASEASSEPAKKENTARDLYNLGDRRSSRAQNDAKKKARPASEDTSEAPADTNASAKSATSGEEGEDQE